MALPSLAGIAIFFLPVNDDGRQVIVFTLFTDALRDLLGAAQAPLLLLVTTVSALGALAWRWPAFRDLGGDLWRSAFAVSRGWTALRLAGLAVVAAVVFERGPELLRGASAGAMVVNDIGLPVIRIYLVGVLFLPLLTEYGLMELVGGLFRGVFTRLFGLPGRAAVDMAASIVSASAVGLIVTAGQYQRGYYSAREACVIACSFSIVSLPFCVLISEVAALERVFFPWYLSVVACCLLCAPLLARLPPLSRVPDHWLGAGGPPSEAALSPWQAALARAARGPGPAGYARLVSAGFVDTMLGVVAPVIAMATLAALVVFQTPLFHWLSWPLRILLQSLGVGEAAAIAPGFLVGVLDQFMPALLARGLDAEFWRFVLGGLSVTQLVFMSEFGVLVLRSPLPLGVKELLAVFALRTLITAPLLLLAARLVLG